MNKVNRALAIIKELNRRKEGRKLWTYFPETGPLRRELYTKHMEHFEAGAHYRERLLMAANRVGKSESAGGYELTLHLTGLYPKWWKGKRFEHPVSTWAAGDTTQTVRDIIQLKLLGPDDRHGTGLIPESHIINTTPKRNGPSGAIETITVKNEFGGVSTCGLKSYDQKRKSFQGTEKHVIWLDEEPNSGIYSECLMRTMTTGGIVILTFTPLLGISEVVMMFLPDGKVPGSGKLTEEMVL